MMLKHLVNKRSDILKSMESEQAKTRIIIPVVRQSGCICGEKFSINTNNHIDPNDTLICEKCNGFILINQISKDFERFKERLGTF